MSSTFAVLSTSNCSDDASPPRAPVDAAAEIDKLPAPLRERFDSKAGRLEMTRALEDKELLIAEARRQNLHRSQDVVEQVSALEDRLVVQALLKAKKATLKATEDELRAFYESKKTDLAQPERVQVRRLFAATRDDGEKAKKKAQELHARLAKGGDFAVLLRESDGPERVNGGNLGALPRTHDDKALVEAAFALMPGATSPVIATRGGYSILVCDKRLPARTPPFEEVRFDVENRYQPTLERRAFEQLLAELREKQQKEAQQK